MKKNRLKAMFAARILLISILCFCTVRINATHITGGELSYQCLGPYTYKISLKVYRDCILAQAPFDSPAKITVWDGVPIYLQVLEVSLNNIDTLPYTSADTNWVPLGYSCVEIATYDTIVTLPQSVTGYYFAYQRCCRTGDIINLVNPLDIGSTYWARVPPAYLNNNSPAFNSHPPVALCVNRPMTFDHSATDLDGDSLVYYLCTPYDGATPTDPQPYITTPPPYTPVAFQSPYTFADPLPGSPSLSIDSATGIITVTPYALGSFQVGVCCDEYRNGVLLGTHHSDFRYSIAQCPYGIGFETYSTIECMVFPNPTTVHVVFKADLDIHVSVFDLMGKRVYQTNNSSAIQNISTIGWNNGVYYYKVYSASGTSSGKLIKQ